MAPVRGAIKRGAALCQFLVFGDHRTLSSYLRRLSLYFLPRTAPPQKRECGPGGSRTRICTLTESRATRCTTGPEGSVRGRGGSYKSNSRLISRCAPPFSLPVSGWVEKVRPGEAFDSAFSLFANLADSHVTISTMREALGVPSILLDRGSWATYLGDTAVFSGG